MWCFMVSCPSCMSKLHVQVSCPCPCPCPCVHRDPGRDPRMIICTARRYDVVGRCRHADDGSPSCVDWCTARVFVSDWCCSMTAGTWLPGVCIVGDFTVDCQTSSAAPRVSRVNPRVRTLGMLGSFWISAASLYILLYHHLF